MKMLWTAAAIAQIVAVSVAAPASARLGQLVIKGTIASGNDGGTDLVESHYVNGSLVSSFAPGSIFGSIGSLAGKAIQFSFLYDTATVPTGVGGLFEDPSGVWPFSLAPIITIGGVAHDFKPVHYDLSGQGANAALTVVDGSPDSLAGSFDAFNIFGGLYYVSETSAFSFAALLPASFFSTDVVLPGAVALPDHGFARHAATGTGSFNFTYDQCLFQCGSKATTGNFAVSSIIFAGVPDTATWATMIGGFGLVGAMARRRRGAVAA